jgi:hypothetical protein
MTDAEFKEIYGEDAVRTSAGRPSADGGQAAAGGPEGGAA